MVDAKVHLLVGVFTRHVMLMQRVNLLVGVFTRQVMLMQRVNLLAQLVTGMYLILNQRLLHWNSAEQCEGRSLRSSDGESVLGLICVAY